MTKEEWEYLETFEAEDVTFARLTDAERKEFARVCRDSLKRKTKQIGLRISEQDLAALRADADRKGIPYQTLINSILHRYVTGEWR
jgi:predicted DNA binding CopG/RHH family protein